MAINTPTLSTFKTKTVGFEAGVNIRDGINFMSPQELRPAENVILSERGGGRKRLGCENHGPFGAAADRVLSTYTYYRGPSIAPQVIIHTTAGALLYTDDPSATPVVWASVATGLSPSAPMSYETFNKKVYMSNGVDAFCSWDGAAYATYASAPKGKYLKLWKDTMWVAGVSGQDDRVYSSAPGDAETYPVSTYVDIAKGDGDAIRALSTDGVALIVGKRDTTHTIYDPVSFANRMVDSEKGFESHFAVTQFEGIIYFLSRNGICRYLGDQASQVVSEKLDPIFHPDLIQLDQLQIAQCYNYEDKVGFAIPERGLSYNSLVIEFYPRIAIAQYSAQGVAPFVFHRMPTGAFTRWRWQTKDQLFASHSTSNVWLRVFGPVGTDNGQPFKAVLQTPFFDMGDQINTKYLRELRFLCSGRFRCHVYRNWGEDIYATYLIDATRDTDLWDKDVDRWGEGLWWFDSIIKDLRVNVDIYGRNAAFRFEDANEPGTGPVRVWVGAQGKEVTTGEWAIYGMFAEGVVLGKRT